MSDASLAERSIELVRTWIDPRPTAPARTGHAPDESAQRLASLLRDPAGLGFTVQFIDRVIRPEDPATAAHALQELACQRDLLLGDEPQGRMPPSQRQRTGECADGDRRKQQPAARA